MNSYDMHYGMGFGMGFGWLILLLFVVVLVYFISGNNKRNGPSARDILDKRYANGEIDEQEYKTKKANLDE